MSKLTPIEEMLAGAYRVFQKAAGGNPIKRMWLPDGDFMLRSGPHVMSSLQLEDPPRIINHRGTEMFDHHGFILSPTGLDLEGGTVDFEGLDVALSNHYGIHPLTVQNALSRHAFDEDYMSEGGDITSVIDNEMQFVPTFLRSGLLNPVGLPAEMVTQFPRSTEVRIPDEDNPLTENDVSPGMLDVVQDRLNGIDSYDLQRAKDLGTMSGAMEFIALPFANGRRVADLMQSQGILHAYLGNDVYQANAYLGNKQIVQHPRQIIRDQSYYDDIIAPDRFHEDWVKMGHTGWGDTIILNHVHPQAERGW